MRTASLLLALLLLPLLARAQRPEIWVRPEDRAVVLDRMARHPEIAGFFADLRDRIGPEIRRHAADPAGYLASLGYDSITGPPGTFPALTLRTAVPGTTDTLQRRLQLPLLSAVDAAVVYWLTGEEPYARYAADVLHSIVRGLLPIEPSAAVTNGGWLYPNDHLREARVIGAQLPVIYDLLYDYLRSGAQVYDLGVAAPHLFDQEGAQRVFRTYARLAVEHGIVDCNWPILEMSSLLHNALALEDSAERKHYLQYITRKSTDHQDALPKIGAFYERYGGTWPESFNYAQHVSAQLVYVLTVLKLRDPGSDLLERYPAFVDALPQARQFTYPDGTQTLLFGDGHHPYDPLHRGLELAYRLADLSGRTDLQSRIGSLLAHEVAAEGYARFVLPPRSFGAGVYHQPLNLLWYAAEVDATPVRAPLPVTGELPFAGITLQRNSSPTANPRHALMYFVGGAGFVHGHASGMNLEVYGRGHVLGTKAGRGIYRTELHENYYRLFAGHNTVVVNGASRGEGDWVNLGIETVTRAAAEPAPGAAPVSPRHSFSTNGFLDVRGDSAEARQQRTVAIVRTSDTTGYYVDVYRSVSELPAQYHDYLYHNLGETLELRSADHALNLVPTPDRFAASAALPWISNRSYRNPGWHYFTKVMTAEGVSEGITASFTAAALGPNPISMRVHLPGDANRSYSTVLAPPSTESPAPYDELPTPTLVVRKQGEAWTQPFLAVLEPTEGRSETDLTVTQLRAGDAGARCCGVAVRHGPPKARRAEYILSLDEADGRFTNAETGLDFHGRFAVVEVDGAGSLAGIYIGEGQSLTFRDVYLSFPAGTSGSAYVDVSGPVPLIRSASPLRFRAGKNTIDHQPDKR